MTMSSPRNPLLEVRDLQVQFTTHEGVVRAVDGVSFSLAQGQTLGVVGESGCGKSVTSEAVMQLVEPPGRIVGGEVILHGTEDMESGVGSRTEPVYLTDLDPKGLEMRRIRGEEIAKIFQEPMASLSPVYTIGNQIAEVIILHRKVSRSEARDLTIDMLRRVGLPQPELRYNSYPFELSGGMRQRAMIAMALSCHPRLLIADEPTTALDVTTEVQIVELMKELQNEFHMSILYISHDLGVVAEIADAVIVMYMGKDVERAEVEDLFYEPLHPYTLDLLRSIPRVGTREQRLYTITGNVPNPYHLPTGCPYHPRCAHFIPGECDADREVPLFQVKPDHLVRCWLYKDAKVHQAIGELPSDGESHD